MRKDKILDELEKGYILDFVSLLARFVPKVGSASMHMSLSFSIDKAINDFGRPDSLFMDAHALSIFKKHLKNGK